MDETIYLSVVIPVYNEANRIGKSLDRIIEYLKQQRYLAELIIVDDGSSDDTESIVKSIQSKTSIPLNLLQYAPNHGKGYAVKTGMLAAKGEFVLFTDADLSTPIEEVKRFLNIMNEQQCQIIIGSRSLTGSQILKHQPWFREKMGKIFNRFVQYLVFPGIIDTQCGFKLFRQDIVIPLFTKQTIDRFSFDVEILYLAKQLGVKINEEPVRWTNSAATKVNPITDAFRMLIDLFRIRWRHRK